MLFGFFGVFGDAAVDTDGRPVAGRETLDKVVDFVELDFERVVEGTEVTSFVFNFFDSD